MDTDTDYLTVCRLQELPEIGGREVEVNGRKIAVFKTSAGVFATAANCPHRGAPLFAGVTEGRQLFCPLHGWEFDLQNGSCRTSPERLLTCYPVRLQGEEVQILLQSGAMMSDRACSNVTS